jgi:hypothetical protein
MRNNASSTGANIGRIILAVLSLFVAWMLGGYVASNIYPYSAIVGGRETLAAKVGCSIAILVTSLVIRRYLLRSFGLALVCLAVTEIIVLLIIICFTGLTTPTLADIRFNAWWLYALTWNVIVAFLVGTVLGHLWETFTTSKKE